MFALKCGVDSTLAGYLGTHPVRRELATSEALVIISWPDSMLVMHVGTLGKNTPAGGLRLRWLSAGALDLLELRVTAEMEGNASGLERKARTPASWHGWPIQR